MKENDGQFRCIGLMSGTSLDGLDIACCLFWQEQDHWRFKIEHATTIPYSHEWTQRLRSLPDASALEFARTHAELGILYASLVNEFIEKHGITQVFLIGSHGQTIFHQPQNGFSSQIGSGAHLAALTQLPVVCDFRSSDVALGGQGAPLVPIGDSILFSEYDFCLNIGGFANISFVADSKRMAFDVCPANFVLNHIFRKHVSENISGHNRTTFDYDKDGVLASKGSIHQELLQKLNAIPYYSQLPPKSLGEEWVKKYFLPVINEYPIPLEDLLASCCEHIAIQIASCGNVTPQDSVLISGGGAYHSFLIQRIGHYFKGKIEIPETLIIEYKEALIFAFLGLLRFMNQPNTLASVTGARLNSSGGCIYQPIKNFNI